MKPIEKQILKNQFWIMRTLKEKTNMTNNFQLSEMMKKTKMFLIEQKEETCCEMPERFAKQKKEVKKE